MRTLDSLLDVVARRGHRPALVAFRERIAVERWGCGELADRASRLAAGLRSAGVRRGDAVLLFAPNSPEWIVACLAALRAGGVALPADTQCTDEALAAVVAGSGARIAFTTARDAERLAMAAPGVRRMLLDVPRSDERAWSSLLADAPSKAPGSRPEHPAALFYTSGTTGPPKGVPLTHANLAFQVDALVSESLMGSGDRLLLPLPLHHVYPFVVGMLVPLAADVPIVLPRSVTGPQLLRALREGEATVLLGVPRLYDALLDGIESRVAARGRLPRAAFRGALATSVFLRRRLGLRVGGPLLRQVRSAVAPKLRLLTSGGAALDPDTAWRLAGLGWDVASGYGLTETSPLLTLARPGEGRFDTVGRAIPGVALRIDSTAVESGGLQGLPAGAGEVLARGPGVFAGYRDLPEKTAEAFTAGGWFRTGDLGVLEEDGSLRLFGRASTLVKTSGGKFAQLEDVEAAYEESPVLREVGVLRREEGLVALVVPEAGAAHSASPAAKRRAVHDAVEERSRALPTWKRISGFAMTQDALPRTRLGKIRRHDLAQRYETALAAPEREVPRGPVALDAMSGDDRALLEDPAALAAWDLLAQRFADRRVAPDSDVRLDLGVDSLGWLDLALSIGERTGTELSDEAIGRVETVRDLLREVAGGVEEAPSAHSLERPEESLDAAERGQLATPGPLAWAAARAIHAVLRGIVRLGFRGRVDGLDRVPREGALLFAPNHASWLDPFLLAAALPPSLLRRTHWAGWTPIVYRNRVVAALSRIARVVPVEPRGRPGTTLALAAAVLRRGEVLVWFPEGGRTPDGRLLPFLPGVGLLLEACPAARAVPVFLGGTFAACPKGRVVPRPHRLDVVFGDPATGEELAERSRVSRRRDAIAMALHDAVAALDDQRSREAITAKAVR